MEPLQKFLDRGTFLWNSGMFCFRAGVLLNELKKYQPQVFEKSSEAWEKSVNNLLNEESCRQIPSISIDYAVMECSKRIKVVPAGCSCVLDDNGTLLWSTGLGHPDKIYLTDIDPDRPGMEVFLCLEPWHENGRGVCVVDARTGQPVWNIGHKTFHVGDGMVADFDPVHKGLECFASEDRKGGSTDKYLLSADGVFHAAVCD
jgi:hypothetical protein